MVTVDWPSEALAREGPPRGLPVIDPGACDGCGDCVPVCPSGCLALGDGGGTPVVDAGACVRCGLCVDACGEGALAMVGDGVLAAYGREDLVADGTPPGEVSAGPSPSRLYRTAVDGRRRVELEPVALLEARVSRSKGGADPGDD